jgi:hypothetical protein
MFYFSFICLCIYVYIYIYEQVNPFCKQNDQEKGFITFETSPKKFFLIGQNGMTIN